MKPIMYQEQQLAILLKDLRNRRFSGTLYLQADIKTTNKKRLRILTWKNGEITHGGTKVFNSIDFIKQMGQKFKRDWTNAAIDMAIKKVTNSTSVCELLEIMIKVRAFTWEQIEAFVHKQVVVILEQVLPWAGLAKIENKINFDLCYGTDGHALDQSKLMSDVTRRQEEWLSFGSSIPSMEAVPHLSSDALIKINNLELFTQLQKALNGQRSLVEIGEILDQDPLELAQFYLTYVALGAIEFEGSIQAESSNKLTILAVDDSPIMQVMLRRALSQHYQVLTAGNAISAMKILSVTQVSLMILDVTMPNIDGLELCRTVRRISKFQNLPIIMLTANDGLINKLKGQIAGSTRYLTKPFEPENLIKIISEYVAQTSQIEAGIK